jgi:hypothetical protein
MSCDNIFSHLHFSLPNWLLTMKFHQQNFVHIVFHTAGVLLVYAQPTLKGGRS